MFDDVDRGLVHALEIDGRAPFRQIGEVLGVSTQTVARRYQRLRAEAGLRVVGLADPRHAGRAQWQVRLTASPRTAQDLANSLARRADTSWVKLTSGGTEIVATVHTPADGADQHSLLLHDIPRTASITAVSAHYLLHTYVGGPTVWGGRPRILDEAQQHRLRPTLTSGDPVTVSATDRALLAVLGRDGRTGINELAAAVDRSPATVTRRLGELRSAGAIFFDLEVNDKFHGATTQALLWMTVSPAHLDRVAKTLATHEELALVAATTGSANLVANALCADPAALHHYLTHRLGALEAIRTLETTPVLRTVKAAGSPLSSAP